MTNNSLDQTSPHPTTNPVSQRSCTDAAEPRRRIQVATGPAIPELCYFTTLRHHGSSSGRLGSLNVGYHVNDDPEAVRQNRQRLSQLTGRQIVWMEQIHSTLVADIDLPDSEQPEIRYNHRKEPIADALMTSSADHALAIMTADCLPIILAAPNAEVIAAVHAGWRGLAGGILGKTLERMRLRTGHIPSFAWIGPTISQDAFEVGGEVVEQFRQLEPSFTRFFRPANSETDFHTHTPWASSQRAGLTALQGRILSLPLEKGGKTLEHLLHGRAEVSGSMRIGRHAGRVISVDRCVRTGLTTDRPLQMSYPQPPEHRATGKQQEKFCGDLSAIARQILLQAGVKNVIDSGLCSFRQKDMLFSHRRHPGTGRMATIVCKSRPATGHQNQKNRCCPRRTNPQTL